MTDYQLQIMDNTTLIFILAGLLLVVLGLVIYIILSQRKPGKDEGSIALLQQQLLELQKALDGKLGESNKVLQDQFKTSQESFSKNFAVTSRITQDSTKKIEEITEKLTRLEETNKQVMGIGEQLKGLEDILTNPKQRGVLGEYYLETVLKNVLPDGSYQMQYAFENGEIVDAVVFVKKKVVPIDSKFSLENYNRMVEAKDKEERDRLEKVFVNDLKARIQETAKYIRPNEGTTEFAFMYIPAEGIYYDLLSNKVGSAEESLIQRAASKYNVIIVSPTSFLAYLQTVLQGLKALEIEERAQDIIKNVEKLGRHINRYDEYYQKLGNTLGTAINHYNAAGKEWKKVDKDVYKITEGEVGGEVEVELLDKPVSE